jgi:hypothetical protein
MDCSINLLENKETKQIDKIKIVMRQTEYSYEEASSLLQIHNNDINAVIRLYLNQDTSKIIVESTPLSINQQIYKEIRDLMKVADK